MSKLISYSFCLVVALLVIFAFSPRADVNGHQVQLNLARLQINDLVQFGERIVAVGERGTITVSDDRGKTWRQTHGDDQLAATLTGISWLGGDNLLAVGHDAVLLRSDDAGETWDVLMQDKEQGEPLLGTWSADGQQIFAYGSFSKFFSSSDQGRSWQARELDTHGEHFNDMDGDGQRMQIMVGEMGLVLRSEDHGVSWQRIEPFYRGSLFGVAYMGNKVWVSYGMRGHVFVSRDDGLNWTPVDVGHHLPLYGHAMNDTGLVIVGTGGAYVSLSREGAITGSGYLKGLGTLTSAVVLPDGELFVAGQSGLLQKDRGYLAVYGQ
ncbi:YCF48-related protein [uncultured Pseudomonas sp.]|uniref:WD40/YVTN/BNR-like repeat-containing protein n=1 Tax=uncultured Pseudomonas sp. TaxID=114707 RepID=UPI00262E29F3|nr:YCF48-related protein [uncultured Pseudomonas sp.]